MTKRYFDYYVLITQTLCALNTIMLSYPIETKISHSSKRELLKVFVVIINHLEKDPRGLSISGSS